MLIRFIFKNNQINQEGTLEMCYSSFPYLKIMDFSNNNLGINHIQNITTFLYMNAEVLYNVDKIDLSGNLSKSQSKKYNYAEKLTERHEQLKKDDQYLWII